MFLFNVLQQLHNTIVDISHIVTIANYCFSINHTKDFYVFIINMNE
jgi:hypothetical protein